MTELIKRIMSDYGNLVVLIVGSALVFFTLVVLDMLGLCEVVNG